MKAAIAEHFASFQAEDKPLEDIRVFVQTALLESSLEKKAIAGLMLAVEEAVTNVLRHGYLYGPGRIRIRVRRTRRWVSIIISDSGRPYSIDTDSAPDAQRLAETGRRGGLGVYLIKKVTDQLDYQRQGDENILTLAKRIPAGFRGSLSQPSMRRRVTLTGVLAVTLFVLGGAYLIQYQAGNRVTDDFFDRWRRFGNASAVAVSQYILNDRSDVEFDQLAVELKEANPGVEYLVILSGAQSGQTDSAYFVRAHSESPDLMHQVYRPPAGVPEVAEGRWTIDVNGKELYHFARAVTLDDRPVGMIIWAVPTVRLAASLNGVLLRVGQWAAIALLGGLLLVVVGANWMSRPVQRIMDVLRNGRSEEGKPPSLLSEPEEIRQVLAAFQNATESVAQTERQLAERDLQQRELEASQHLQRTLMPQGLPNVNGYAFGASCRMARQVGGDYYDVLPLDGGLWLIIVADVAGKGLPAGLVMTALRTATRLLAPLHRSPKSLLSALHEYLVINHPSSPFVTACCLVLDPESNRLEISSAGHTPALVWRADTGVVESINPRGRPMGIPIDSGRSFGDGLGEETIVLEAGDRVLLFTDGLVDARSEDGESYGLQRVEDCLKTLSKRPPAVFVGELLRQIDHFSDGADSVDDLTLLVLDRLTAAEPTETPPDKSSQTLPEKREKTPGVSA